MAYMDHDNVRDRFQLVNHYNIKKNKYTQSLISEALRVGMIPMELVDDIQMQVRGVLELLLKEQRSLNGSQVDKERAQALLDSVFYAIDAYLLSFHDPLYAINALQGMCVEDMYQSGMKIIRSMIYESVALSVKAKKTRIQTDNEAYNKTLDEDVHVFLDGYDYRFAGQQTVMPMQYRISGTTTAEGIFYLRSYLNRLYIENCFAAMFDSEEKALLFSVYAKQRKTTTRDMRVNLFALILNNALGAVILGKYAGILTLTEEESAALCHALQKKTVRMINQIAIDSIKNLIADMRPDPAVTAYLNGQAKQVIARLTAVKNEGEGAAMFIPSDPIELFKQ